MRTVVNTNDWAIARVSLNCMTLFWFQAKEQTQSHMPRSYANY